MNRSIEVAGITAIRSLLAPESIAIIGASGDRTKMGAMPLAFLRKYGYAGKIYPVNPGYQEIDGLPCYASVRDIPGSIDLMVVTVPAGRVSALLAECEPGKVHTALVLTSGYAEMGPSGERLQAELAEQAAARGIRLCGPNSVGAVNLWDAVVPSISQAFDAVLEPGNIAFVTQSGALGTAVIALARAAGLRLGYFISTGNEGDLDFADFCEYFIDDPKTKIIAGYLEGVRDGRKFATVARRALEAGKPIVLLKVGRTAAGTAAARSHTGSLTGSDALYEAVFNATGVIRVDSIEALLDTLQVLSALPPPAGNRMTIVTHSGGTGVLMSDACVESGIAVPPSGEALKAQLQERLPAFAALNNPIDMTAGVIFSASTMVGCLEVTLAAPEYDLGVLAVNLMWRIRDELAQALIDLRQRAAKPFAVTWIGIPTEVQVRLQAAGVPAFSDPVRCVQALARLLRWGSRRQAALAAPADPQPPAATAAALPNDYAGQAALLERYGVPLAPWRLVHDRPAASAAAAELGYPVVAKLIDAAHSHKSDVGGVAVGLRNQQELDAALNRFHSITDWTGPDAAVLVQPMVQNALEVLVGAQRDPVFGSYVVVGLGGIYVEVFKEASIALAPASAASILALLQGTRWWPLLQGVRGQGPRDPSALAELVSRVSLLAAGEPVSEMDLNPVMVRRAGEGVVAVDFRLFGKGAGDA